LCLSFLQYIVMVPVAEHFWVPSKASLILRRAINKSVPVSSELVQERFKSEPGPLRSRSHPVVGLCHKSSPVCSFHMSYNPILRRTRASDADGFLAVPICDGNDAPLWYPWGVRVFMYLQALCYLQCFLIVSQAYLLIPRLRKWSYEQCTCRLGHAPTRCNAAGCSPPTCSATPGSYSRVLLVKSLSKL